MIRAHDTSERLVCKTTAAMLEPVTSSVACQQPCGLGQGGDRRRRDKGGQSWRRSEEGAVMEEGSWKVGHRVEVREGQ